MSQLPLSDHDVSLTVGRPINESGIAYSKAVTLCYIVASKFISLASSIAYTTTMLANHTSDIYTVQVSMSFHMYYLYRLLI